MPLGFSSPLLGFSFKPRPSWCQPRPSSIWGVSVEAIRVSVHRSTSSQHHLHCPPLLLGLPQSSVMMLPGKDLGGGFKALAEGRGTAEIARSDA